MLRGAASNTRRGPRKTTVPRGAARARGDGRREGAREERVRDSSPWLYKRSAARILRGPITPPRSVPGTAFEEGLMYAVFRTGGKQYRVETGDKIRVEKLPGGVGAAVSFGEVFFF